MDFGGASTSADTDRLVLSPPVLPDAGSTPSNEAVAEHLARAVERRCIDPAATRLYGAHDPTDHLPVIHPGTLGNLRGHNG